MTIKAIAMLVLHILILWKLCFLISKVSGHARKAKYDFVVYNSDNSLRTF